MQKMLAIFFGIFLTLASAFITSRGGKLYDTQGRQIIFRGPNVVVKIPPYSPNTQSFNVIDSFCEQDMKLLKSWGFNAIRLGVMWAGVQTSQNIYSQQYLQKMKNLVNLAGKYGIYSLVEFHQDIISQKFCGDGIPFWVINKKQSSTYPLPLEKKRWKFQSSGLPKVQNCNNISGKWGNYYFTYDVSYVFNDLYTNRYGLLDKFQNYWIQLAKTFANNPYVLGYELINEPFAGSLYKNPLVIVPSMAQRIFLQNFYDRLATTIRKYDSSHPICFQPVTWDNTINVGFSHPPGGQRYQNQSILCYHFYIPPALNFSTINARINDAKRLNIASILSQFYYKSQQTKQVLKIAYQYRQSWLFWYFKTFGKNWGHPFQKYRTDSVQKSEQQTGLFYRNGSYIKEWVQILSQTYVQRLSGQYIQGSYDGQTKYFSFSYYPGKGTTVIFANRQDNYPNGLIINVSPKNAVKITQREQNYFQVNSLVGKEQRILISISRL